MDLLTGFIICVITHELGHYVPAVMFDSNPKFSLGFGVINMKSVATPSEGIIITIMGILTGVIPILFFNLKVDQSLLLFVIMIAGSSKDFRMLLINIKMLRLNSMT